jgi:hypothetical protein
MVHISEGSPDDGDDFNEVLPGDGLSAQPSFGLAEDAERNKAATPDWPQAAVLDQVEAIPQPRDSPNVMLPEGANHSNGQHTSGLSAGTNRSQLRRSEYTVRRSRVFVCL